MFRYLLSFVSLISVWEPLCVLYAFIHYLVCVCVCVGPSVTHRCCPRRRSVMRGWQRLRRSRRSSNKLLQCHRWANTSLLIHSNILKCSLTWQPSRQKKAHSYEILQFKSGICKRKNFLLHSWKRITDLSWCLIPGHVGSSAGQRGHGSHRTGWEGT